MAELKKWERAPELTHTLRLLRRACHRRGKYTSHFRELQEKYKRLKKEHENACNNRAENGLN